ncbi:DUF2304 domain-containing protein [Thermococcus sibiricus]|uniref:UDP-N-acetylglucosamine--dolichyl-phosphate N-acetylglucosaminephosphotransferase n=1 Tax=Thermococcus sibiricus (strain DSM 12597 / MM 739) TaxID=604354 RepID=C6A3Y4_THESM|nr:DUF2304 family protein [Thermococcus sibiricus]ACS90329.1 UDP-N-acetylglucosamine--dolichyl-phosphate N-acetylglucosaminephosphotransferase [Thermococcus sibiricus MM 739]
MYAIQYIALLIISGLIIYLIGKYGKKELDWQDLILWESLLLIMLVISLKPIEISMTIKRLLGLGRGLDALFVVSIGLSYLILFRLYMTIDKTEREITELTRQIAIEFQDIKEELKKLEKQSTPPENSL